MAWHRTPSKSHQIGENMRHHRTHLTILWRCGRYIRDQMMRLSVFRELFHTTKCNSQDKRRRPHRPAIFEVTVNSFYDSIRHGTAVNIDSTTLYMALSSRNQSFENCSPVSCRVSPRSFFLLNIFIVNEIIPTNYYISSPSTNQHPFCFLLMASIRPHKIKSS